jgi:hypothetical protein
VKTAKNVTPFFDFASRLGIDLQVVLAQLAAYGWAECEGKTITITSPDHVTVASVPFRHRRQAEMWVNEFNERVRQNARMDQPGSIRCT